MTDTTTTTRPKLLDRKLGAGVVLVLGLLVASLAVGQYDILGTEDGWEMFRATRVPRTIALVLAGAAMAMSGLIMQMLTQNRFVEPTTTGTTEWAGLGLLTVIWDLTARRAAGVRLWLPSGLLRDGIPAFLSMIPVALAVYLATWTGWFRSTGGYRRQWAAEHPDDGPQVRPGGLARARRRGRRRRRCRTGR